MTDVKKRNITISLIALGLLCRLVFTFSVPAYMAPDEKAHMGYVLYILENKTLPVQPSTFDLSRSDYEYYQPPLYYLTMSLFVTVGKSFNLDDNANVLLVRSISVLLWLVTITATCLIVKKLEFNSHFVDLFIVAFVSFLPSYMFISSMINNDNLITCLASVLFLTVIKSIKNLTIKDVILMGVFSGLAFLTKYTGVMVLAFVAVFMLLDYHRRKNSSSYFRSVILVVFVIGLFILPFLLHNKGIYGAFIPLSIGAHFPNWDSISYGMYRAFKSFLNTFWGVAGMTNNIKFIPAMVLGNLFALIALYGIVKGFLKNDSYIQKIISARKSFLIALLISVIVGFITVIYYGIIYGQAQGRFLFPLIIPIGIWMAVGFKNVFGERVENYKFLINTTAVFVVSAVTFTAYTLFRIHAS